MKKSNIFIIFIIIAIIAMIATSSAMDGLGFALSVILFIFSIMCIGGGIYLAYSFYEKIKKKDFLSAFGDILSGIFFAFLGVKILVWLVGVLF